MSEKAELPHPHSNSKGDFSAPLISLGMSQRSLHLLLTATPNGGYFISLSQMRKLRLRELNDLSRGNQPWVDWDLDPGPCSSQH